MRSSATKLPKLRENHVEDQVLMYLRYRGWEPLRLQAGTLRGRNGSYVNIGEKGRADWLMLRASSEGTAELFYFEAKRPGGKRSVEQIAWAEEQMHRGFLVTHADSIEGFENWYAANFGEAR